MDTTRRGFLKGLCGGILASLLPFSLKATPQKGAPQRPSLPAPKGSQGPKDAKIRRQGYIHSVFKLTPEELKKKFPPYKKFHTPNFTPKCDTCKWYKKPQGDYGECIMVGANGKPGKLVFKDGLCKVFAKKK